MTQTATAARIFLPCSKCQGAGYLPHHANVAGGVCFSCAGTKGKWTTEAAIARRADAFATRKANAEAGRLAKVAEMDARWDAFAAEYPELAAEMIERAGAEVAATGYCGRVGEVVAYVRNGMAHAEVIERYNRFCR